MSYKPPSEKASCIDCRVSEATHYLSHSNYLCIGRCQACYESMIRVMSEPGFNFKAARSNGLYVFRSGEKEVMTNKAYTRAELDAFYVAHPELNR